MLMCTSAQPCEGLMPDCSISKKESGSEDECVCSTHNNLLTDKPMYAMSLIIVRQGRLEVTDGSRMYTVKLASGKRRE